MALIVWIKSKECFTRPYRILLCFYEVISLPSSKIIQFQGPDLIRVSRFYKEAREGKFITYLYEDSKTLYESFRKGAKESSESKKIFFFLMFSNIFLLI